MSKLFHGQYIGVFRHSNTTFTLMINADSDRKGSGVAYINIPEKTSYIYECFELIETDSVISGKVKRSKFFEDQLGIKNLVGTNDESIYSFQLDRSKPIHILTSSDLELGHIDFVDYLSDDQTPERIWLESWEAYKVYISDVHKQDRSAVYRGVSRQSYKLRTSFHRLGRANLERYRVEDFPMFRDLAETIGNIDVGNETGAMWGYAQHHGFPTPFLDWSESAYVAAYFAFSDRLNSPESDDEPVSIYVLSGDFVQKNKPDFLNLSDPFPRLNILKPSSKGNHRLVFQQGLFLVSNVVNIESYLMAISPKHPNATPILKIIDLPASEAKKAISELAFMGTHEMSLFPGLDGAARFARNKQFFCAK